MNIIHAVDVGAELHSRVPVFSQAETAANHVKYYRLEGCSNVRSLPVEGSPVVGLEESLNYYFLRCHKTGQLTKAFYSLRDRNAAYQPFVNYFSDASGCCDGIIDLLTPTVTSGLIVWSGIKHINIEDGTIDRDGDIPFMTPVLFGQVEHSQWSPDTFQFRVLAQTKKSAKQLVRAIEALHYSSV
ncbi:MAG: hypothetical protein IPO17_04380 [Flavobacteriales bacterium]|nr:hypothetical protein [Flavobacteriales bacterium]